MKKRKFSYVFISGILIIFLLISGCNGDSKSSKKSTPTAIEMMTGVFEGNHKEVDIKTKMDAVMTAYNIEITERNYEKCASALVSLRKAVKGVTEMEIIENMLELDTGKDGVSFPDQAALSATLLEK